MSSLTWRGFGAAIAAAFLLLATSADAAPPSMTGIWTGKVAQIGREGGYALVLTIAAKGVTTDYPDLGCAGKLTRIGASANYVFYSETITKGRYDAAKSTGCIDGTMTLTKQGEKIILSWF